jgi:MoxR-like ATPase
VATRPPSSKTAAEVAERLTAVEHNVAGVVEGKPGVIRLALVALLSEGHVLVEDVPGVGKTLLAKALASSLAASVGRVQFTPDLLPTDITGVTVYNQEHGDFEFRPGAVFANIVLADEINRAGPKTQAALLEAMEERTVTVDGTTYELGVPFMVVATQNPIELDGTYPLPEAQRDRFVMRLSLGYPSTEAELEVLNVHGQGEQTEGVEAVLDTRDIATMIEGVKEVYVAEPAKRYIVELTRATREHPAISLGASPRASLALLRTSRSLAAARGRDYLTPDDVQGLVEPVLAHRLLLTPQARVAERTAADVLAEVVEAVPVPAPPAAAG